MVFSFPFDEVLNLAVRRLPGRRFDWETREWTVPCMEHTAEEVAECSPASRGSRSRRRCRTGSRRPRAGTRWRASWDDGYGPVLGLRSIAGVKPDWLEERGDREARRRLARRSASTRRQRSSRATRRGSSSTTSPRRRSTPPSTATTLPRAPCSTSAPTPRAIERFELWVGTRIDARDAFLRLSRGAPRGRAHGSFALAEQRDLLAVPADPALLEQLDDFLTDHEFVELTDAAADRREQLRAGAAAGEGDGRALDGRGRRRSSRSPLGGELRPFQRAGVLYALHAAAHIPRRRAGARQDRPGARGARGRRRVPGGRRVPRVAEADVGARGGEVAPAPQHRGAGRPFRARVGSRGRRRRPTS